MRKFLLPPLLLLCLQTYSQQISKQLISSQGGELIISELGMELSWSIGQIAGTSLQSENLVLTQGYNQNNAQTVPVYEWDIQDLNISTYPNPFNDRIIVRQEKNNLLDIEIFDLLGNSVAAVSCQDLQNVIELRHLPDQPFLVTIRSGSKYLGMRIVKISH